MAHRTHFKISDAASRTGLSIDTLRYYEKIGLLTNIHRTDSGLRLYSEKDISRLSFIQRAQRMNFTLAEIQDLLLLRENPQTAKQAIRKRTMEKLHEVEARLQELQTLRNEITLLLNLCQASQNGCPIINQLDDTAGDK
jgi:DNA-binding transcriptional MerR regulator